jgi:hypothetical protein
LVRVENIDAMKVICIDAGNKKRGDGSIGDATELIEGAVYTVVDETMSQYGTYGFLLKEVKSTYHDEGYFRSDRFVPLSDIDEMELVENNKEKYQLLNTWE